MQNSIVRLRSEVAFQGHLRACLKCKRIEGSSKWRLCNEGVRLLRIWQEERRSTLRNAKLD